MILSRQVLTNDGKLHREWEEKEAKQEANVPGSIKMAYCTSLNISLWQLSSMTFPIMGRGPTVSCASILLSKLPFSESL